MSTASPFGAIEGSEGLSIHIASIELNDVDRTVIVPPRVGVTAIVGGNNTGKSTLLYQINQWLHGQQLEREGRSQFKLLKSLALEGISQADYLPVVDWLSKNATTLTATAGAGTQTVYHRPNAPALSERQLQQIMFSKSGHLGQFASYVVNYTEASSAGVPFSPSRRARPGDPPGHPNHYIEDNASIRNDVDSLMREVFGVGITLDKLGNSVVLRLGTPSPDVPPPGYFDDPLPFREELDKLSTIEAQGDGIRSFLGKLLPIVTAAYPVVIIDEPEAFLHPPQAFKMGEILGRVAKKSQVQVMVATHDRNILLGLLKSDTPLSIVRLSREGNRTSASVLSPEGIGDILEDPVLRYSHVLDGLFHSRVVVVENERDCTFYSAAIDAENERAPFAISPSEVLLVASHGKDGIPPIVKALATIRVPVIASPDIDILNDPTKLKKLVDALGGDWTEFEQEYLACTNYLRTTRRRSPIRVIAQSVQSFFDNLQSNTNDNADWTSEHMDQLRVLLRTDENPWTEIKKYGVSGFKNDVRGRVSQLLDRLDQIGIVVVRVGELESFANEYSVTTRKGIGWLREALIARVHEGREASNHVKRLMLTASPQTPPV
jgi:hypothetical protein